jgi:hypothetical protein
LSPDKLAEKLPDVPLGLAAVIVLFIEYEEVPHWKPTSIGDSVAFAKEPDKVASVELFIVAFPVVTVAAGSSPIGSSPPTPPPDWDQFVCVILIELT